ncbi:O-sialoglycoprotein endopeptidase [Vulcanibacillus modesticaldus]|uniref:N(6)-L-threonylcarbamoyladenine synthase n=1 Tax=Vulcanibacillus modesticaldus TaxID=337097 RepID=A0A1D2YRT9_9BACI|nr:O-sialoglycoprotein endopeptidase [Vulcanibacillus modesticaldus]OEF95520.1 O-sialoglycoprotein endopeptidase [Vulcanibacillus modesticaldus]
MDKIFLGIDTSNYMTSICFIDENRKVIFENRQLLLVKDGEKGLKQSDALFQHVKNLPQLFKEAKGLTEYKLSAIAVSKAPRPVEGSYMPVFMAGLAVAESMAATFKLPLIYTTHQEGHISAGLYSSQNILQNDRFMAVHLSGGTSEILLIENNGTNFQIEKIGGTLDLHAGQLIDRIGVALGLPFPAGRFLEDIARRSSSDFNRIPSAIRGFSFHFSGAETEAKKRIQLGEAAEEIARSIEHVIAVSIEKVLRKAMESGHPKEILLVGGVAQNQYIRDYLIRRLEHPSIGGTLHFADKNYSGDNAYGVANIALNYYLTKGK